MSRMEDRMLREGNFLSPHEVAAQQDHARMLEVVDVIDPPDGAPGWVTVKRTSGRPINPAERLTDSVVFDSGPGPGVTVRVDNRGTR